MVMYCQLRPFVPRAPKHLPPRTGKFDIPPATYFSIIWLVPTFLRKNWGCIANIQFIGSEVLPSYFDSVKC